MLYPYTLFLLRLYSHLSFIFYCHLSEDFLLIPCQLIQSKTISTSINMSHQFTILFHYYCSQGRLGCFVCDSFNSHIDSKYELFIYLSDNLGCVKSKTLCFGSSIAFSTKFCDFVSALNHATSRHHYSLLYIYLL